jgi:hypothetical protein
VLVKDMLVAVLLVCVVWVEGDVSPEMLSSLPSAGDNDGMFTSSADLEVRHSEQGLGFDPLSLKMLIHTYLYNVTVHSYNGNTRGMIPSSLPLKAKHNNVEQTSIFVPIYLKKGEGKNFSAVL